MIKKREHMPAMSDAMSDSETQDFVTFTIADQLYGIPVFIVQDVLGSYQITRIPLAPQEISGSLNLRGRVVTAVDVRIRLGLEPRAEGVKSMSVVTETGGELYSLIVDSVNEVVSLSNSDYERNPPTLDAKLRAFSDGIYRPDNSLLVVLDVKRLLDYGHEIAA